MALTGRIRLNQTTEYAIVYTVCIYGQSIVTTVTKNSDVVKGWIDGINPDGNTVPCRVGFEVQLDRKTRLIGTLQFYTGNRCLVFHIVDTQSCPPCLEQFLSDNLFAFVGIDIEFKTRQLCKQLPYRRGMLCADLTHHDPALREDKQRTLASFALGMVDTDWCRLSNLSEEQVMYASLNVFLNYLIAMWLFP